jgi:hypothetical protein
MNNCLTAAKKEHPAGETPAAPASTEGNCSGHGHEGCCGNHRQEDSSSQPGEGCCGH